MANPLPLILLGGAALFILNGKNRQKSVTSSTCPPLVIIYEDKHEEIAENIVNNEISSGNRNPFQVANMIINATFPPGCSIRDYKTKIKYAASGGSPSEEFMTIAEFYYVATYVVAGKMLESGLIRLDEFNIINEKVHKDYTSITGKNLPF